MFPPGQKARADFPRFGLPRFATRFPSNVDDFWIDIEVDESEKTRVDLSSRQFERCTIERDFHCVTTWSYRGAVWSGVKFTDLFEQLIDPCKQPSISGAVFYAQDGNKTSLLMEDLLSDEVIVADKLDGEPLSIEHGAPLRLIAPDHYGYKNLKHLSSIKFYSNMPVVKRGIDAFLDHPRARVNQEERSRWIPGWILRYVYRFLIAGTVSDYKKAMKRYKRNT